ncbi:MAG: glycosyltransferase [Vicinamibacterales bacterium]
MRIGLQTWGSEGDIRPFVALAHGLSQRGHTVELVYTEIAERRYDALAATLGFTARGVGMPIINDPAKVHEFGRMAVEVRNPLTQGRIIVKYFFNPAIDAIYDAAVDLCRRSDLIIGHFFLYPVRAAAEKAGVPEISVTFAHTMIPSRTIHPIGTPHLGEWGNALGWRLARLGLKVTMGREINRFRARVGVPPIDDVMFDAWASHRLNLVTVSPSVFPAPPDWPAWNKVCGFLSLPDTTHEQISPELAAFLAGGAAPVFMAFGSLMPTDDQMLKETMALLHEAATRAGCRTIIQANAAVDPSLLQDRDIIFVNRTPHHAVFPRCAAVVHHSGAGTTQTVLQSGVPSIPVPHVSDQFSFAEELERLGVACRGIPRRSLTAARLARRVKEVLANPQLSRNAEALRDRMKDDNGVATAVALIEQHMERNLIGR